MTTKSGSPSAELVALSIYSLNGLLKKSHPKMPRATINRTKETLFAITAPS
ncbi:MAG: hypothetical protein LBU88_03825 [Treponema sp.]|nr:hypothetical protein [Treponema sp.]